MTRPSSTSVGTAGGENADTKRRVELRAVAKSRIAALGRNAKLSIERRELDVLTELAAGSLESSEAKAFLDSIPTPRELMPTIDVAELGSGFAAERQGRTDRLVALGLAP